MFQLNLPSFNAKIATRGEKTTIYDVLRRKYVALTPEEWVRQHFVNYLINFKNYPSPLLANELPIRLNSTNKRCDTVLLGKNGSPKMIIEYKAPHVEITQKVFSQISRYNIVLHVDYLIVTNGLKHYCCKVDYKNQKCLFLKDIPSYEEIEQ